eukprot:ANDGO_05603.mRNA.1 GPI mannosyltransferase 4
MLSQTLSKMQDVAGSSANLKWYLMLIGLRLVFAAGFGYIHPDEYFQSAEIVMGVVPWEFRQPGPIRSFVHPLLTGYLPFSHVSMGLGRFISIRMMTFLMSLIVDFSMYGVCKLTSRPAAFALYSSSWVSFVFMTRSFSNCSELVIFSVFLYLMCRRTYVPAVHSASRFKNDALDLFAGAIACLGIFTRFTFLFFAGSFGLGILVFKGLSVRTVVHLIVGFCFTFTACVIVDSRVFFQSWPLWTCTPLNNFVYNTQIDNLAIHGIHPRWLHAVANLPMLYGPMAFAAIWAIVQAFRKSCRSSDTTPFLVCIALSMLALSAAPHQEPRFLLPLLVPICIVSGDLLKSLLGGSRRLWVLMFAFNLALGIFFGFLHQGGLVPASLALAKEFPAGKPAIVWHGTFMPPRSFATVAYSAWIDTNNRNPLPYVERACTFCNREPVGLLTPVIPASLGVVCKTDHEYGFHVDTDNLGSHDRSAFIHVCTVDCDSMFKR